VNDEIPLEIQSSHQVTDEEKAYHINSQRTWENGSIANIEVNFLEPNFEKFNNLSPSQIFEMFITNDILSEIVDQTNHYALYKYNESLNLTINEIKCILGIMFLSGYNISSENHIGVLS
jgi:hypothetical protein